MPKQSPPPPPASPLLPLICAAMFSAVAVVACDRGPGRQAANAVDSAGAGAVQGQRPANAPAQEPRPAPASPPREALSDPAITSRIQAAMTGDAGMGGADISVQTHHGVVSLVGNVKSQEQIAIASAHAQRQDGVLRVDNNLSVAAQ